MCAKELVLKRRTQILNALCDSGSAERLERVLDVLLAHGELQWEEYQGVQIQSRTLYGNGRHLLDLVHVKGERTCELFLGALKQVLPEALGAGLRFGDSDSEVDDSGPAQSSAAQNLLTQRPRLVGVLQGCIDGALDTLVKAGHLTSVDCSQIQLAIHTPSQKARCLLDHVRSKGESAAGLLLQYAEQHHNSSSNRVTAKPSTDFLKYRAKLCSSVTAQSCFLSTYGGTGHMLLDDIYIEGEMELSPDSADVRRALALEDVVGGVGTVNEEADAVLVSGDAGSGKSTLLQRLHLLWARGEALVEYLLLFPFSCRRLNAVEQNMSVKELLFQQCCWPDREQEEIFQYIIDYPHLIIFTFDGLDELKHSFSDEHRVCCPTESAPVHVLLFNLIQGYLMKGVRKVVTSRPEAVGPMLKRHLRKEVLLKGFSTSSIDCFVRKQHSDPTVATKVLGSLQANTVLLGLCHSPVLCWIVSHCYKELLGCGDGSPQTITDVYLMILQHFLRHKSSERSSSRWLQEHQKAIVHLGQLAFKGVKTSCFVFTARDLDACRVSENDIRLGFLIQSKDMSSCQSKRYEFPHVTLQCFFAALYIVLPGNGDRSNILMLFDMKETGGACFRACLLSPDQQNRLCEREVLAAETSNLQITATFVSGLLSQRHQSLWLQFCPSHAVEKKVKQVAKSLSKGMQNHFKSIPQPVEGEKKSMHAMPGFVWLIKCIYEMQESKIAKDAMVKLEVDHLKLVYCNIGPMECTALAYVLQHLKNPVGLQLDNNSVGDVGVEQLLPCMHICSSLYLRNNNITDEGIRKLLAKGIQCESFQKIALFNNKLTDGCMSDFAHLLKTKQDFASIRLGNNYITEVGAKRLAEGLRCNSSLKYLGLWGNKVGDDGAKALADALEGSKSLVWLSLVGNNIGSLGACSLAKIIKNCTSLEELWLTENHITTSGVECLIEALQENTKVKSVWLRKNDLSSEEKQEMASRESRLIF
ncbi:nucleotide-binding oligomerization domain-containing protein 2 [Neosynchiropus ocellatus]